eukprot:138225-Rhodomonas_salina.1
MQRNKLNENWGIRVKQTVKIGCDHRAHKFNQKPPKAWYIVCIARKLEYPGGRFPSGMGTCINRDDKQTYNFFKCDFKVPSRR